MVYPLTDGHPSSARPARSQNSRPFDHDVVWMKIIVRHARTAIRLYEASSWKAERRGQKRKQDRNGKMSRLYQLWGWVIINGDGWCSYVLPTGGPTAQVYRFDPKVGGRLALFCIHRVNRVNSRNDSVTESRWQHHKHYPGIIIGHCKTLPGSVWIWIT